MGGIFKSSDVHVAAGSQTSDSSKRKLESNVSSMRLLPSGWTVVRRRFYIGRRCAFLEHRGQEMLDLL